MRESRLEGDWVSLPRLAMPKADIQNTGKNPASRGSMPASHNTAGQPSGVSNCNSHQSPREDVLQRRQNGPNSQSSWFRRSGVRPNVKPGPRCRCCCWSRDPTLRNVLLPLARSSVALLSRHPSPPQPFSHCLTPSGPLPSSPGLSSGLFPPFFLHHLPAASHT